MEAPGASKGIISLAIKDTAVLYAAYMSFVESGGIFVPTPKHYKIGDEVFVLLTLMDEPEKIPCAGKVVWITPQRAQGNRAAGIGVQFTGKGVDLRNKIESYLAGSMSSGRQTHTM